MQPHMTLALYRQINHQAIQHAGTLPCKYMNRQQHMTSALYWQINHQAIQHAGTLACKNTPLDNNAMVSCIHICKQQGTLRLTMPFALSFALYTEACICPRTHTYTRMHARTHEHTHIRTHTHALTSLPQARTSGPKVDWSELHALLHGGHAPAPTDSRENHDSNGTLRALPDKGAQFKVRHHKTHTYRLEGEQYMMALPRLCQTKVPSSRCGITKPRHIA
eukprot:1162008-Pelagomonas_calceolata.AAC.3